MENQTTYTPDWANIPKSYRWVAVDKNGRVFAFINKPAIVGQTWDVVCLGFIKLIDTIAEIDNDAWKEMLYQRPKPTTT